MSLALGGPVRFYLLFVPDIWCGFVAWFQQVLLASCVMCCHLGVASHCVAISAVAFPALASSGALLYERKRKMLVHVSCRFLVLVYVGESSKFVHCRTLRL